MSHQPSSHHDAAPRATHEPEPQFPSFDVPPHAEWFPLDDIIQTWARFAHATRSAADLCAVSAAFAALAAESAARSVAVESHQSGSGTRPLPDALWADLTEARLRWLEVLGYLSRIRPQQDEEVAPLLSRAGEQAVGHEQHLLHLSLRLARESNTDPSQPLRVWAGTLALSDEQAAAPKQEAHASLEPDPFIRQEEQA